jgi:hypothetical protein
MGLKNFTGETFVAFSDLCGFKKMLKSKERAYKTLSLFYNTLHSLKCHNQHPAISALAVSDCIISYVHTPDNSPNERLESILKFLKLLHQRMIREEKLVQTTIAYGDFTYENRLKLPNMQKTLIFGNAYLKAYIDNEKAEPGMILLLDEDGSQNAIIQQLDSSLSHLLIPQKRGKIEYFWSVENSEAIGDFERARAEAKDERFLALANVYKRFVH